MSTNLALADRPYGGWLLSNDLEQEERPARTVSRFAIGAITLATCVGTGGSADADFWARQAYGYRAPVVQERSAAPESSANKLNLIRETLKPAMTDLATVFGVSRQALYSWANGEKQPSGEHAEKLDDLAQAVGLLAAAGLSGSQVGKRKIADGKTLLQVSQAGGSASHAAGRLIAILEKESEQRARLSARLAGRKQVGTPAEDIGAPMLHDQA